jgi:hypothetical protein
MRDIFWFLFAASILQDQGQRLYKSSAVLSWPRLQVVHAYISGLAL